MIDLKENNSVCNVDANVQFPELWNKCHSLFASRVNNQEHRQGKKMKKRLKLFNFLPIPLIGAVNVSTEHGRCSSEHIRIGKANIPLNQEFNGARGVRP